MYFINFRAYRIVKNKNFDFIIIGVIVASSLKLVIDTYFPDSDPMSYSNIGTQ